MPRAPPDGVKSCVSTKWESAAVEAGVSWMDSSASKWTPTLKGVAKEQMVTWVVARPHSWPEIREGPGDYHIEDLVVLQCSRYSPVMVVEVVGGACMARISR